MKSTRIKVSISQDGSLSKEFIESVDFEFPLIPKKLLKSMGFEKVDDTTYVGMVSVFLNLLDNEQEIEIELGVEASDARKKILDLFKKGFEGMSGTPEDKEKTSKPVPKTKKTKARKVSTAKKTS
ncbi:MAG: hypothetical protein OXC97_01230 [Candidatus Dadabacteria bacterium]|nr:hypothetical protein [Candidatus Dadabacteria bacterium]